MLRIIANFFISIGNIFRKSRTVVYPKERIIIPEGSRGLLKLKLDLDTLEVLCNGCGDCQKVCPQDCIRVKKNVSDPANESLEEFYLDLGRCNFCGNCVEFCKYKAIEMSYRYQSADYSLKSLRMEKLDLVKQADYSIRDFWLKK